LWEIGRVRLQLHSDPEGMYLVAMRRGPLSEPAAMVRVIHGAAEERLWLLAGTYPDAPILTATPLPDALDAAVRWMAERAP
jgi:hypothetical protein